MSEDDEKPRQDVSIEVPGAELKVETYRAGIQLKHRNPNSANRFRVEEITGQSWSYDKGDWVELYRLIDKDNDRYIKRVVDEDTGEVIYECDEPLSDHQGRGSAKER